MSMKNFISDAVAYNLWAHESYIKWLQDKPEEQLRHVAPSSFPTMLATLEHIHQTQDFWLSVVRENPVIIDNYGNPQAPPREEVFGGLIRSSQELVDYVDGLDEATLAQKVSIHTEWFTSHEPRFAFLHHCLNHSTYHRGQVVTLGRMAGITDAPMTDYNAFLVSRTLQW